MAKKLIFPIGFDLEDGVKQVEKDWANAQKRLQKTFQSQTIGIDADISEKVLNKLYTKFEGLIKSLETKAPQVKLKIPDTVDFEQEIKRLKVQLKSINLGELTDNESKDLYLYIRQLEALAKALKEVNKQEQLRQANDPSNKILREAQAQEKLTRAKANDALAEQRRAKIAVNREQQRAATARAEQAELRLANAKNKSADATNRQNKAYGTQLTYIQRLMQRLAIVGGLYQTIGFVTKIREVTAEFELQRVALGAIIKDGYEASKMFEQIKAAAVKSPFEIKDLVSYTKQLAAYKIETKDLFDTTMQLADISAGLGVGMERLVLAFGQIRATGYLRAAEVRQLTEAGIPIVEELAEKLSAVRGELVSAGDVMQMISERAISFGMVKEVFDDMTSAGGTFYKMQEKQAETLAGQWSNLKDTLSIMYDEIGRSSVVQGLLQGFIDSTKTLASNWQTVKNVLLAVGGLYAGFKVQSLLTRNLAASTMALNAATTKYATAYRNYILALNSGNKAYIRNAKALVQQERLMVWAAKGTTKLSRAFRTLWATIAANPIGAVLTVLTLVGTALFSAWQNATKLNKELNKIGSEGAMQADQQVRNFERLAKAINENTVGSKKHDDALQELKRTYGELLPARDEDILALVKEKSAHESVTQAIREKIAMQMKEQKINAITSEYGEKVSKAESNIRDILTGASFKMSKEEASYFVEELKRAIEREDITDFVFWNSDSDKRWNAVRTIMENMGYSTEDISTKFKNLEINVRSATSFFESFVEVYSEYNNKITNVTEEMENQTGLTGKLKKEWEDLQNRLADVRGEGIKGTFDYEKSETEKKIIEYRNFIAKTLSDNKIEFTMEEDIDLRGLSEAIQDATPQVRTAINMAVNEYRKLIPSTDFERLIQQKWQEIAKTTGASMDKWKNYFYDSEKDVKDFAKEIKDALEKLETDLAVLNKEQDAFEQYGVPYANKTQEIEQAKKNITALGLMLEFLKPFLDATKKGLKDSRLSDLKKQIQDVTNAYKKYIELRKYMSKEDALENIAMFFPSLGDFEPTYENMVARLQKLKDEVQAKLAKSPADKTLIDMSRELEKSLANIKFDKLKTDLEQKLARLSEDVAKTKTAKEFYDRILGITGDRELSATFTMSVYGESGDELAQRTIRQLEEAFQGIDLSDAINYNNFQVDWKKVADIYKTHQGDMLEANRKTAEELIKNAQKVSAEQIQQWVKELEQVKSYADKRVELARQTAERIKEIEQSNLPQEQKDALTEQYRRREEEQASKLQYEAFKDSPAYVEMFNNLDNVSTRMLEHLREKLQDLQEEWKNLDPTQLKELQSRLNAIDEQLASRNPFKALTKSMGEYFKMRKEGSRGDAEKALTDALIKQADAHKVLEERIKAVNDAQKKYDEAKAGGGESSTLTILAKQQLDNAQKQLQTQKELTEETDESVNSAQKLVSAWDRIKKGSKDALGGINDVTQALTQATSKIYEAFGSFGGDDADKELFGNIVDGLGKTAQGVTDIVTGIMTKNPVAVINGAVGLITAIANLSTSGVIYRANKEIATQQERIDSLSYAYGRLEKAMESALGTEVVQNYQERINALMAQETAYLKQADAERSKGKKADQDKIKEYEDAARDAADNVKDMYSELQEYFLGTSLTSAARDFAQSWIEAYKQFGSTTDAMKEKFADMIQNMIIESLAAKVMKQALEPVFTAIDEYTKDGTGISVDEAVEVARLTKEAAENSNVGMTNLMNALKQAGLDVRDTTSGLTGISKDIASASEESILGLAAGINTQNFYISQIHANVALITQWVQSGGMATQGVNISDLITLQNQHLSYLPNIAANTAETLLECRNILYETTRIADTLGSVVKPQGVKASYRLNTSL